MFTVGSLFDGSGGFPLAAFMCGGVPVWASEIEPYPIAVTKSRFPYVKHLGSVTDIKGNEIDPVDIITFGSPCQDLSVAGKRAGLKHEDNGDEETTRSGLFMEAVRIIREMREATNGVYPRIAVWENVPGAFSSNKGEDFRIVLEELIKIVEPSAVMPAVPAKGWNYADCYSGDGWSLAYRVFDAQHWGVPQRRRRIYLIVDFGGKCAGEILFKRNGLRGHFEEGRTPWEGVAGNATDSTGAADCEGNCVGVLASSAKNAEITNGEISPCLMARAGTGGNNVPILIENKPVAYSFDSLDSNSMKSSNPHSGCRQVEVAKTIDTTDPNPSKNQGGIAVVKAVNCQEAYGFDGYNSTDTGDKSATWGVNCGMSTGRNGVVVPYLILDDQGGQQISVRNDGKCPTLRAETHGNLPRVMEAAGFKELNSAKARSDAYEHEVAPCLSANKHDASVCVKEQHLFKNHSQDTRYKGPLDVSPMLPAQLGTGGNNTPFVVEKNATVAIEGNGSRPSHQGDGYKESDVMYTLNTIDRHAVAYCIGNGQANQSVMEEYTGALNCMHDQQAICYGVDCRNATEYPELNGTLQAKPGGGTSLNCNQFVRVSEDVKQFIRENNADAPHQQDLLQDADGVSRTIACGTHASGPHLTKTVIYTGTHYIVRRLTPTECARLQGFPDDWGHPDKKTELTDEEYEFWLNVRNTHAAINGKAVKDYTKQQMLTWYNKLHTDSSEYKMWGNGIALPNALYVMQGIAEIF